MNCLVSEEKKSESRKKTNNLIFVVRRIQHTYLALNFRLQGASKVKRGGDRLIMVYVHLISLIPSRGVFRVGEVAANGWNGGVVAVLICRTNDLLAVLLVGSSSHQDNA